MSGRDEGRERRVYGEMTSRRSRVENWFPVGAMPDEYDGPATIIFHYDAPDEGRAPTAEPSGDTCNRCGEVDPDGARCPHCGDCLTCGVGGDAHAIACPHAARPVPEGEERDLSRHPFADALHEAYLRGYNDAGTEQEALDEDAFTEAGIALSRMASQPEEHTRLGRLLAEAVSPAAWTALVYRILKTSDDIAPELARNLNEIHDILATLHSEDDR